MTTTGLSEYNARAMMTPERGVQTLTIGADRSRAFHASNTVIFVF
jgi:hypothetical protein